MYSHDHVWTFIPIITLLFVSSEAQSQTPTPDMKLNNARLVVLQGKIRPATTAVHGARSYAVPETCRFRYHVPAGSNALGWRQIGDTLFHEDSQTCDGAFIEGEPVLPGQNGQGPLISNPCPGTTCRVSFTAPWRDPIYIDVAYGEAEVDWSFNQPGSWPDCTSGNLCATYNSGSATPYGFPTAGWYQYYRWGEGPLVNGEPVPVVSGPADSVGYTGSAIEANGTFFPCTANDPVHIKFDPTQIYGYSTGAFDGWASSTIYGGLC